LCWEEGKGREGGIINKKKKKKKKKTMMVGHSLFVGPSVEGIFFLLILFPPFLFTLSLYTLHSSFFTTGVKGEGGGVKK
jgi:hypothetical protein